MKFVIAVLLATAIFIATPDVQTPTHINKSTGAEARTATSKVDEKLPRIPVNADKQQIPVQEPSPQTVQTVESETQQVVAETPVVQQIPPPTDTSEAEAKSFIYFKESGNDPTAENSIGCFGIGQDCNGIVKNKCGTDYNCQDSFFTDYMLRRYGSWVAAKTHWLARVPIDGRDVGHWW